MTVAVDHGGSLSGTALAVPDNTDHFPYPCTEKKGQKPSPSKPEKTPSKPSTKPERATPNDMEHKEPWEAFPDIWKTPAAFWAWVRGGIRGAVWKRYPAKLDWKRDQMVPPPEGYTGRAKSLGKCHYCKEMFAASHLEVDHVKQAGSCNSWETANQFMKNLLDTNNNWVLACRPCHKIKSYAERTGMDFQEALAEKRAIEFLKNKPKDKVLAYCESFGYNPKALTNDQKRRAALVEIFTKEKVGKESST